MKRRTKLFVRPPCSPPFPPNAACAFPFLLSSSFPLSACVALELLGVPRLMMSLMLSDRVYCLWIPEKDKRSDASPILLEIRKFKVIFFLFKNLIECNYLGVRSDKFSLDLGNSIRFYTFSLSSYSWSRYSLETHFSPVLSIRRKT